jgi:3-hydroxybutyryl-CoA dehydratase
MSYIRKKAVEGLRSGETFTAWRTFTQGDVVHFADVTRDYNPIHFDERFARVKKFQGRICHGLLVASIISEIGGQIGWLASGMTFNFRRPVYFGDTITCFLTITDINEKGQARAEAVYQNQDGVVVLEASLTGIIPGPPEQQVLKAMIAEGDPTNKLR